MLLAIVAFLKSGAGIVLSWLSKRSMIDLACLALLVICAVQFLTIRGEKRHSAKLQAQVVKLSDELKRISTKRNEQKAETGKRIVIVKEQIRHADEKAKVIEQAPLPGQCRTPQSVMDADL